MGDWGAKVWNEDLKSPIIRTKYHNAFLADGCFSPVRPGLLFLIRKVEINEYLNIIFLLRMDG